MTKCDLRGANLRGAVFSPSRTGSAGPAILSGVRLTKADLTGADLRGVDLREVVGLTPDQLDEVLLDEHSRLPLDTKASSRTE